MKKTREKKKNEIDFTIHLNEDAIKETESSQEKIKEESKRYEDVNKYPKRYYRKPNLLCKKYRLLEDLILLKGKEGQIAYVRHDLDCEIDKWKLIVELPLDLTVEKQRDWIGCASKFFKPLFIREFESASSEKDFDMTQKPYKEYGLTEFDPAKPETKTPLRIRLRSYADSAPYASKTTRKQDLKARNEWIKKRYKQLKKDKTLSKYSVRYDRIATDSVGKTFGNLKIRKPLETFTIKNILYSKSQKISD